MRIYEWGFSPLDLRRREDYAGLLRGKACAGSFFLRQITHKPPSSSGLYARGSLHRASTEGCPLFAIVLGCCPISFVFTAGRFLSWVGHCLLGGCSVFQALFPVGSSQVRFRLVICMAMPQRTGWYGPVGSTCLQIMDPRAELRGKVVCGYA